jgi:hypothetical protein
MIYAKDRFNLPPVEELWGHAVKESPPNPQGAVGKLVNFWAMTLNSEVVSFEKKENTALSLLDLSHSILPFSRILLSRFAIRLNKEVDYRGEEYLAPYLLCECVRAEYLIFFKIKSHPIRTGKCIFDNSTYPPDLLPGILRPEGICQECRAQMNSPHAFGGWSVGRGNSAEAILNLARKKLLDIMVRTDEEE